MKKQKTAIRVNALKHLAKATKYFQIHLVVFSQ